MHGAAAIVASSLASASRARSFGVPATKSWSGLGGYCRLDRHPGAAGDGTSFCSRRSPLRLTGRHCPLLAQQICLARSSGSRNLLVTASHRSCLNRFCSGRHLPTRVYGQRRGIAPQHRPLAGAPLGARRYHTPAYFCRTTGADLAAVSSCPFRFPLTACALSLTTRHQP